MKGNSNIIKCYAVLILYLIGPEISMGQNSKNQAEKILNKAYEKIKNVPTLYMRFTYQRKNKKGELLNSESGKVYAAGNRYRLSLMEIIQIGDGKKIYTISSKDKEVTISSAEGIENILSPVQMLSNYIQMFNIEKSIQYKKGSRKILLFLKLTPKKESPVKELLIGLDPENNDLKEIHELENDNYTTSILINEYLPGIIVSKTFLKFEEEDYPDYVITDID
ncbi:LolA family protein [Bacteroidetes bacterium endosymbiont of Geopemphigus sp.]|uniref:LolA family protein n=1 Tax=Bacteroidetes bacterium endosymbiont of Geopemphigus sp. TaxID=2047937 RepID=UPI0011AFBA1B|nr:outer membrane lipoprotein carrier protein LolA [Bacteroidetes bacterium endosymbiont of Geopemphigus sp.]